ncbi:MAG: hypothetical protein AB7H80_03655 [Candidatus Kapaibacterium sp.]
MPIIRYCDINPNGGTLTVTMSANNGLRAGGRFGLYTMGKELVEDWSIATGDGGSGTYQITTDVSKLDGYEMAWRTKVCAFLPGVNDGSISVEISQNGKPCKVFPSTEWDATDVPSCESGKLMQKTFSLIFQKVVVEEPA